MKKVMLIIGMLLLLQLVFVSATFASGPNDWGGDYGRGGYWGGGYNHGYGYQPNYGYNYNYHPRHSYYYTGCNYNRCQSYYPRYNNNNNNNNNNNCCCRPSYGYQNYGHWNYGRNYPRSNYGYSY